MKPTRSTPSATPMARATDALIGAEQRLFNAQGINDRLLAMYYAEHREHCSEALARRVPTPQSAATKFMPTIRWLGCTRRWDAGMRHARMRSGRYGTARRIPNCSITQASSPGTPDTFPRRGGGSRALATDPHFHPFYAAEARRVLTAIGG